MIVFWISAGTLVLIVALLLLRALLAALSPTGHTDGRTELNVYRDQLGEVQRDQSRGILDFDEAERFRIEVQRRMLDADRLHQHEIPHAPPKSYLTIVGALFLCLGASVAVYISLGVPGYPDLPLSTRLAAADEAYQMRPSQAQAEAAQLPFVQSAGVDPELAAMIDKLRAAVASRPDDLLGLTLLATNEASLGNFVAARKAQEAVVRLKGAKVSAQDLSALAQLMVFAAGGTVTAEAEKVLIQCLQIDPRNGWARYYSGLMFAEVGRPDRAFSLWEPLLREGPGDVAWTAPIRTLIEDVAAAAGINYRLPAAGPDDAAIAAAAQMTEADRAAMIRSMVSGLEERLNAEGGPVEDWARLITSLGVLAETDRAKAAYEKAQASLSGRPGALAALRAAAVQAGVAP